ncbi:aspartate kinase [Heliobacterium gestii]|uniref:Aspartokinase n=1 Tax=Heliomicrobium gestii TaxID=2699 RepID=A0A845LEF8_HELGE|nr:aspartate kinase [Heliomicrobium gestii]MBM7868398.1 aspartate kinase [Heliomicrobium gestii]MZP44548.1 aspartate kinase [Heliomicrobium gestii]
MRIAVLKFGGTSVANEMKRNHAVQRIGEALEEGYRVIVVVSAMGRKPEPYATDTLLSLVREVAPDLPLREQDMLMACGEIISTVVLTACLRRAGIQAVSLTGWQAGVITTEQFGDARIQRVDGERIRRALEQNRVAVIAGFQGTSENGEIATLGRGGSDTTAVAIGAALAAEVVDIFTDVKGVYTVDPHLVSDARVLPSVTYREVCQLAQEGAKVIHPRAVEIAMKNNQAVRVRSTDHPDKGTLICAPQHHAGDDAGCDRLITGIAHMAPITQIKVDTTQWPDPALTGQTVFQAMAEAAISVDFINVHPTAVIFTVADEITAKATQVLEELGLCPEVRQGCAKVAVVGIHMTGVPGVMAQIVLALNREKVPILQSADSYTTIWCLIPVRDLTVALNALHRQFCLS